MQPPLKQHNAYTMMRASLKFLILYTVFTYVNCLSEKQFQTAVKLARNSCISKTKIKTAELNKMQEGQWDDIEYNSKCFLFCLASMNQLITAENKMNYEHALELVEKQLPEPRKAPTLASANECRESAKTLDDSCIASWEMTVCLYNSNPSNFFLFA